MNNVVNLTCLSCCPIVISNSQSRQVADVNTQSGSDAFVTGSLVYAGNQVNQMQKFEGQASEGLFNQGQEMAGVSRFVNRVELEQLKTSMVERSNSPIPENNTNLHSSGFIPFNSTAYYTFRHERNDNKMNQENGSEYLGSESPPPPPPPREQRSSSPLPEINPKILSPGFMGFEPCDPKTGGRLNTFEVLKPVEVTRTNPSNASQLIGGNESELWV